MRIGWLCKHGGVNGEVERPANSTLQELRNVVKADHAKVCKIGGHTWILIDAEWIGRVEPDGCSVSIDIPVKADNYFVLLHVQ